MKLYDVSILVIAIIIGFTFMWGALYIAIPHSDMTVAQYRDLQKKEAALKKHHDENCRHKKERER